MKNKVKIFFAFIAILSALFAIGCSKNVKLEAPSNIHIDSIDYLRWDKVKNADSYLVIIDDEEYNVTANELDLFDKCTQFKEYSVKIRAYGSGAASDPSYFKFKLSQDKAVGYKLTQDQTGLVVTTLNKTLMSSKVIIPDEIKGKPVVELAPNAFSDCDNLTVIRLPDSITSITNYCFYNCKNLRRIKLPDKLTQIKTHAFSYCKKLEELQLPGNIKIINDDAFKFCESLKKINLPVSLQSIFLGAFENCINLNHVKIPYHVNILGPSGIDTEISVDENNPNYYSLNNCILDKRNDEVVAAGKLSVIPSVATAIGTQAFENSKLKKIVIPQNIKTIKDDAFLRSSVEEVVIENGTEEICQRAFGSCYSLKKISIPASVSKIANGSIFYGCNALEEIVVSSANKTYYALDEYILTKANDAIVAGTLKKPIPAAAKEIAENAFYGNPSESVFVPPTIKKVSDFAFNICLKVKTAVFCSESIGSYIFGQSEPIAACFNITSIRLSKNVKNIAKGAFYNCHNVDSITLPDNVRLGGYMIVGFVPYTVYYPKSADLSALSENDTKGFVQSEIAYDGDFPYVKSIKPAYITTEYNGKETTYLEHSHDFLAPTRDGYTFEGWSKNEDCSTLDYPVYIREAFTYEKFTERHYYLESRLTHNPFHEKQNYKPNEYYDPEVKILYAVWRKV